MNFTLVNNLLHMGGAEESLCRIAAILSAHGHAVTVITMRQECNYKKYLPESVEYVFVIYDSTTGALMQKLLKKTANFLRRPMYNMLLRHRISRVNSDVCITFKEKASYLNAVLRSKAKKKVCWFRHDITDYSQCKSMLTDKRSQYQFLFSQTDLLLFVTENALRNFRNYFLLDTQASYVYNSINLQEYNEKAEALVVTKPKDTVIFICVARYSEEKGQDLLINAANILKEKKHTAPFEVWFVGESSNHYTMQFPKCNYIKNLGYKENPAPYIKAADVLICPSRSEGCPNVILEGMALGKPILTTKTSGGMELTALGTYGIMTEISAKGIEQGMEQLMDPICREHYSQLSRLRVLDFSNESCYKKMSAIFSVLIKET